MGDYFTDVEIYPSEETLFLEEINAVMRIVREILGLLDSEPNKGTIIIDGQRKGRDAQCIMQMNLKDGIYRRRYFRVQEKSSDELATDSIDAILEWPENDGYDYKADLKEFGGLPTGVYLDGPYKALVLNTTFGRFIMSFQLALEKDGVLIDCFDDSIAAMKGVAVALAKMGKADLVLRQSVKRLKKDITVNERMIEAEVENLLVFCNLPELQAWKEWHEAAMGEDKNLALYFEIDE